MRQLLSEIVIQNCKVAQSLPLSTTRPMTAKIRNVNKHRSPPHALQKYNPVLSVGNSAKPQESSLNLSQNILVSVVALTCTQGLIWVDKIVCCIHTVIRSFCFIIHSHLGISEHVTALKRKTFLIITIQDTFGIALDQGRVFFFFF